MILGRNGSSQTLGHMAYVYSRDLEGMTATKTVPLFPWQYVGPAF
ncbi:hypothetical protein [Bacteroides faecichinchillae]|nr:hypothetical protein [Bacteroides faecichinchillae]